MIHNKHCCKKRLCYISQLRFWDSNFIKNNAFFFEYLIAFFWVSATCPKDDVHKFSSDLNKGLYIFFFNSEKVDSLYISSPHQVKHHMVLPANEKIGVCGILKYVSILLFAIFCHQFHLYLTILLILIQNKKF